ARSAPISTSRFTILPQIRGPWLQITHSLTTASWQRRSATIFTPAAATPPLTKHGATIQVRTLGPRSQICLQAARQLPPELTTAGGCLQAATSTSPSAPARLPGTRLRTVGAICQAWSKLATTSQAQPLANPFTLLPAAPALALVPM